MKKVLRILAHINWKGFSLKSKGKVYTSCARYVIRGSEIWTMNKEHMVKLDGTEANVLRWMCGLKPKESIKKNRHQRIARIGSSQLDKKERE